jgi:farnesyl diphosphate synthase
LRSTNCCQRADGPEAQLTEAMRYAGAWARQAPADLLRARDRPMFDLTSARCCGRPARWKCIQAYSLIHDDLPCMDDDDMRRGRPDRAPGL